MRTIAIIGAGQAGLQLGLGLLKNGYAVSLFTNRNAGQILNGHIMSNQAMFNSSLQFERKLGLNFWDEACPQNNAVTFALADPNTGEKAIYWQGYPAAPYQSVDQRLKFSRWLDLFESLGGHVVIEEVGLNKLDKIAQQHDLTIVASGKNELSQAFSRDNERSEFDKPQRNLACMYFNNIEPIINFQGVRVNVIPGVGEFCIMPGLTLSGPCEMVLFEAIPHGPFDCWDSTKNPDQQLQLALQLIRKYVPWEAERCTNAQLTDNQAILIGAYAPTIRQPTFKLPCGKYAFGIGDSVILNDPIAGQGSNNASKAAYHYMERIIKRGEKPFDQAWMQETHEQNWVKDAKWSTALTSLLLNPPAPHVVQLLETATKSPTIADTFAKGFDTPEILFPWILSADHTNQFIKENMQGRHINERYKK